MTSIPSELRGRLSEEGANWLAGWLADPFHEAILPRLRFLLDEQRFDELADAFSKRLSVGTGGMRGAIGVGPNRFNHETLGRAIQGHAEFLKTRNPELFAEGAEPPTLVLAYDVRCFHDLRGIYEGFEGTDPLTKVTSFDFARFAAIGYAMNGIRTKLPPQDAPFVATPELSLAIRSGGHLGGINLSASHNPPDDSGVKFYNAAGAQLSGEEGDALQDAIWNVELPDPLDEDATARALELVSDYDLAVHEEFVQLVTAGFEERDGTSILYAPLEGVGADSVADALERVCPGVHVHGDVGDGSFQSVPYGLPNPEISATFEPVIERANREGQTLLLASDPDADRIAAVVRDGEGAWRYLSGNQVGSILLEWLCRRELARGADLHKRFFIQTCVTGEETARIAESHGLAVTHDLPVGFKFIARAVDAHLAAGRELLMAFEESIGYLLSAELREKDAAGAAVAISHAHLDCLAAGRTLWDSYVELNARHGYYQSGTRSVVMKGPEGVRVQEEMIRRLRAEGGVPGTPLSLTRDFERDPCTLIDLSSTGDRKSLNVLELRGEIEGAQVRMAIRRSGTEPKIKLYFDQHGSADAQLDDVTYEGVRAVLSLVDEGYSRVSHALPDHIPLVAKEDFATRIAPEVVAAGGATAAFTEFLAFFKGGSLDALGGALRVGGAPDALVAQLTAG